MKVWILAEAWYEDMTLLGAYSTAEIAERHRANGEAVEAKAKEEWRRRLYFVTEIEVDADPKDY